MKNNILLSIICITYNHEMFLEKAIKGFLMQKTNFNYEILIHDDASTDGTAEIIKKYEKLYPNLIKVIYQKENQYSQGKSPTLNLYNIAKGKYLAFCEGDDYWIDEYKLQKQVDFLEKNNDYYATYHNVLVVDEEEKIRKNTRNIWQLYTSHSVSLNELQYNNYLAGQTATIVCRNFWKEFSFKEKKTFIDTKTTGDRKLSIIFCLKGNVYYFKDIMSCYRLTFDTDSWSSKNKNKNLSFSHYKTFFELKKFSKEVFNIDYNYDLGEVIFNSFIFFLKNLTKDNFNIFITILKKSTRRFKDIYSALKIFTNRILIKLKLKKQIFHWEVLDQIDLEGKKNL